MGLVVAFWDDDRVSHLHWPLHMAKINRTEFRKFIQEHCLIAVGHPDHPKLQNMSGMTWMFEFKQFLGDTIFLQKVAALFWEEMETYWPFQLAGVETASYPMMTAIQFLGLQKGYDVNVLQVRKSRKKYGLFQDYDGTLADDPIVLVDDLIHRGKTTDRVCTVLSEYRDQIQYGFSLVDFERLETHASLKDKNIVWHAVYGLSDFPVKLLEPPQSVESQTLETWQPQVSWQYQISEPRFKYSYPKSAPVMAGGRVFLGFNNGLLAAFDADTGQLNWSFHTFDPTGKGSASTPVIYQDWVIMAAYDGSVYALDQKTGNKIWQNDVCDFIGASPVLEPESNTLVISCEFGLQGQKGGIMALDAKTGQTRWVVPLPDHAHATPAFSRDFGFVFGADNAGNVMAVDLQSGHVQWQQKQSAAVRAPLTYDARTQSLFVAGFDNQVTQYQAKTGEWIKTFKAHYAVYTEPLITNGKVVFGACDKHLYCYDLATGDLDWSVQTWGRIFSHPVLYDDQVFFGSNDGGIRSVGLESGELKNLFFVRERILTPITFFEQKIYISTGNEIFAIEINRS